MKTKSIFQRRSFLLDVKSIGLTIERGVHVNIFFIIFMIITSIVYISGKGKTNKQEPINRRNRHQNKNGGDRYMDPLITLDAAEHGVFFYEGEKVFEALEDPYESSGDDGENPSDNDYENPNEGFC